MIKVTIFDDHKERRDALKLLLSLQKDMECISDFEDCSNLVSDLKKNTPQVVLMDIHMPCVDGIAGVKLLRQNFPDVFIIMQTVFEDDENLFNSLLAGAHGYILKKSANEKIIEGITEVVNGGAPMTPAIAKRVLDYFSRKNTKGKEETFDLSKRERDVLTLLVKGYSHKMIAAELFISTFTVNNHIKNIYQKMQVHSVSEAVATAIQKNVV
ncbi:response regulator [Mucilaginibacter agri]|uniref:Response regulator n=1 Tax=Mucilaginibacter agri TaxID=2695265 RepID=A0A965ZK32_9SPHI|nr:response regulator transcription factor [Mucilaginibacter agri]NCD71116.1 response regulator [Mucilaginibacter agri]